MTIKFLVWIVLLGVISCRPLERIDTADIVVVGGGLMGSSAAWHLSQNGEQVLLLEQQAAEYSYGSSYGDARIARSLGPEGDMWSYLHNRSVFETKILIDYLNSQDDQRHSMEQVYTTSPVSYVRHKKQQEWLLAYTTNQRDPYRFTSNPDSARELFGFKLSDSSMILREIKKHSGTINPRSLIKKLHRAINLHQNKILYGHRVDEISVVSGLYHLKVTEIRSGLSKTISCKRLVSAAGPYTGILLQDMAPYFNRLIDPKRVFLSFLKIPDAEFSLLNKAQIQQLRNGYPVINSTAGTREDSFFSMIEGYDASGNPLIKIGGHYQRTPISDLDSVWRVPVSEDEIAWSKRLTLQYLQNLNLPITQLEYVKGYSCVYSLTESEVPYVTTLDESDPTLVVMGGMSGVGAKGAMCYGLIAANLMNNVSESDSLYISTAAALGFARLSRDLN